MAGMSSDGGEGSTGSRSELDTPTVLFVGGSEIAALAAELATASDGLGFRIEQRALQNPSELQETLAGSRAAVAVVDACTERMRGEGGWRLARDAWPGPIVIVCAAGDDACARAALADGAEDVVRLSDPSASAQLGRAIARALARGRNVRPAVELSHLQARWEALNGARDWYLMEIDGEDRISYLSRSSPDTSPASFVGQSVFTFTHPDAQADVRARLERVRQTGESVTVEERAHGTLGDDSWFVARCLPVKRDGRVTSILVVTENVTERHRLEQLLANSERRFRALIENSSDAIVLLDRQARALYASPATREILGFAPEEIVGRDFTSFLHPEDVPSVVEARAALYATPGGHVAKDVRLRHKDGTWRLIHGIGTNLLDDPAVRAVVGNYRDLSAQRALEEQVRRTQQWEAIGLLAGGIAHDFNNLLCVIMAAASAAAISAAQGGTEAAALEDINQAAARAAELTRKLLTLGRTQPLALEHLDAGDLLSDFAALMRRSLGEGVEVVVSCEGPLHIRVDRLQIEQVLLNVCTNARQAMDGRGRVRIDGRCRELPANGAAPSERVVEIAIRDDGPGMDEATLARVFEPFFTTKREGSGLGLTVSYGIVQRHGGTMSIESHPGSGTLVTIQLPVHDGPREERAASAPRRDRAAAEIRILVAEDEPALRRIFSRVLREEGYGVIEAEDGNAAVTSFAADAGEIGLVVLDVRLPMRSGPEAYQEMLRHRGNLPVLFVTGHAPDTAAIPAGAPLLVKPFTGEALLRGVEDAIVGATARARSVS